jgi:hypothetical protein
LPISGRQHVEWRSPWQKDAVILTALPLLAKEFLPKTRWKVETVFFSPHPAQGVMLESAVIDAGVANDLPVRWLSGRFY